MKHRRKSFPSPNNKAKIVSIAVSLVILVCILAFMPEYLKDYGKPGYIPEASENLFSVHYIDVGQGDSSLLCSPKGEFMLIDCGPSGSKEKLISYLYRMDVEELEYLVVTHPHEDHYGGVTEVMDEFKVKNLILHKDFADFYPYDKFIRNAKKDGTKVLLTTEGDKFTFDGCAYFEIIGPHFVDENDLNESSLCFKVTYGDTAFLFTGDAEQGTERYMLDSGKDLKADVFQLGHHGSSTSNTNAFVEAVDPVYGIASCEKNNDYGHPHRETVGLFKKLEKELLITYRDGDIVFTSDGEKVTLVSGSHS